LFHADKSRVCQEQDLSVNPHSGLNLKKALKPALPYGAEREKESRVKEFLRELRGRERTE
jgi:hypothetical protein